MEGTTGEDLVAWLSGRIARYKVPVRIDVLGELPKGPTGKILNRLSGSSCDTGRRYPTSVPRLQG